MSKSVLDSIDSLREYFDDSKNDNLSLDELATKLNEMYNDQRVEKVVSIHLFGIKYGQLIRDKMYSVQKIIQKSGISSSYFAEINKGIKLSSYVRIIQNSATHVIPSTSSITKIQKYKKNSLGLNTILYGAPGTGKTYSTAQFAIGIIENIDYNEVKNKYMSRTEIMQKYHEYVQEKKIVFTTFHQNYGYEDFIEGLRPKSIDGCLSFEPKDGIFKVLCDEAIKPENINNNYVLIIDEINRANISRVFGELITLIEIDKRDGAENSIIATLPSGRKFTVPQNVYILGTMNSADKSISLIDVALRRRFDFIEVPVDLSAIEDDILRSVLESINNSLENEFKSTDLLIGHAYFLNKTIDSLENIMNKNIIPLLYEYLMDNRIKIEKIVSEAIKATDYKCDSDKISRLKVVKK